MKLFEIVNLVDAFLPVKIIFNNLVLYNDYDNDEYKSPLDIIPERIKDCRNSIVEFIEIDIVQNHHSIIRMRGQLVEE
jgi:hypothetical protein